MKTRFLCMKHTLFLLFVLAAASGMAQEIKVKEFRQLERDLLARTMSRTDLNDELCAIVRVVSDKKGFTFEGNVIGDPIDFVGETIVYLTGGSRAITIKHPDYGVLRYEFPQRLEKSACYEIVLRLIENPDTRTRAVVMAVGNTTNLSESSDLVVTPGVMLGFVKRWGGYVKGMYNFNRLTAENVIEMDNTGYSEGTPVWVTSKRRVERMSFTAGALYRVNSYLCASMGAGYGYMNVMYKTPNSDTVAKNIDKSYKGVEAEAGVILRLKLVSFYLGVQTNSFKHVEGNIGIGYIF